MIASATSGSRGRLTWDECFAATALASRKATTWCSARDEHRSSSPRNRGAGLVRLVHRDDGSRRSGNGVVAQASPAGGVLPIWRRPIRGRPQIGSGRSPGTKQSHTQKQERETADPRPRPSGRRQRLGCFLGRVRPSFTCRVCHRSISGRNQRLGRPRPRSRTGRGMSGYRCRYWLTVLRWVSPRIRATSCASMRSSMSTRRATDLVYT